MPAILRFVAKTDTFETQRQKINQIATDVYNVQTSVGEGAFSMSDGSVQQPALYFTNAQDVGVFRGSGKSLYIAADGASVASFDANNLTALQDFRTLISSVPTGADGITISNGGAEYSSGVFNAISLTGGSGVGIKANLTVTAIEGDILNGGNGYVGGSYVSVPMLGGSGTGATADITVSPFTGSIQNGGTGGDIGSNNSQIFTNVSLTGGSGNGMRADITVTNAGANVSVTGVNIVNQGSGYQTGNVLSAVSNTIGGVTGFQYVINGVGNVSQIQILLSDGGYQVGNILTVNNSSLGGSGSGFQFEVTGVGIVTDAAVVDGGDGYLIGDQLSVNPVELAPSEIWYVRMWMTQLFEFSGTLPTTGFNVGDTLSYSGETRTIVKRFLNEQNEITSVAVRAGAEDGNTIQFSAGLSANDGNGNSAVVASTIARLNYYFSLNQEGPYENIRNFTFQKNKRYIFNQANSSNISHPIRFSTTPDGIHTLLSGQGAQADYGDPYEGDEVNYAYTSVDVSIIPNDNTPTTLYYYCSNGFGNPANEHIDEGGFDDREGVITISGEATISGGGLIVTVGQVDTESNIVLNKDGTAVLGQTSASSLTLIGNLSTGGSTTLSGNLSVGSSKFTVNSATGDTFIAGSLTVDEDLSFLADAALGSTLYVDSVNNKVSINIDPQVTALTKTFEIFGDSKISNNVILSTDLGSVVNIGSTLTQGSKFQVDGSIYTNLKYYAEASGNILNPLYTFNGLERVGLVGDQTRKSLSIVTTSGECLTVQPTTITFLRNAEFDKLNILSSSIIPGEGYEIGSYSGIELDGGTGFGFVGNVIVAFVGDITNPGSGYTDGEYISNFNNGSGSGATLRFTVVSQQVDSIVVTNGGTGYLIDDVLTINPNTITDLEGSPVSFTPSADAEFTITSIGSVTEITVNDSGEGYISGDSLYFYSNSTLYLNQSLPINYNPWLAEQEQILGDLLYSDNKLYEVTVAGITGEIAPSHTSGAFLNGTTELTFVKYINFLYNIDTTDVATTVIIDKSSGDVSSESITTNTILVSNNLSIAQNSISSTQNDNINISPGSSSKLLSISGTGGIKVPVGTSTNRPSAGTLGIIRYNSQTSQYEGSNGTNFISLGGVRDVDGNTYILAEKEVGANDNTLYFFTNNINNSRLTSSELTLVTATTIASRDTENRFEWEQNTAYDLEAEVYYGDNLYEVTLAGTTSTTPPSHTTGAVTDGTAELTYVSSIFGNLTLEADTINLNAKLSLSGLEVYAYNTNNLIFENSLDTLQFAFGNQSGIPDTLVTLTDTGEVNINKSSGTANPVNNISVIDKTLKYIELDDIRIETSIVSLLKGTNDTGTITLYDPTEYISAKIFVTADNTTTDDRHIVEYNVIDKGSNIIVNEYGNLDTGVEIFVSTFDFGPDGSVRINPSLLSTLSLNDIVNITVSVTKFKK